MRTKRLKTCSSPTAHIAAKIAATPISAPRSTHAKTRFKAVLRICSSSFSAPNSFASSSCALSAACTSGRVSISFTFMPSFFTSRQRLALALRRHLAHHLRRLVRRLLQRGLLRRRKLLPLGEREHEERRIHQVLGERHAARHLVHLERDGGRRGVLVAVEHAALQRGVDLAEVHRRGVRAHRVDRRDEHLGRDGADLEALEVGGLLHLLLRGDDVAVAPAHRPRRAP